MNGGILGENRDTFLALEIEFVHGTFLHVLVRAKCPGLLKHGIHERRLAMIHVRDNGDIANVVTKIHHEDKV